MIDEFLAGVEPAVWGSDLDAPQILTAATAHQICHSQICHRHQARDLTFAAEADTGNERIWALALRHVFGRAIRLHHERAQITPVSFARRRTRIEKATDRPCETLRLLSPGYSLRPGAGAASPTP